MKSKLSLVVDPVTFAKERNLRIVVLDSFYDFHQNPTVRDLFVKLISLKIKGYQTAYPYGVLPVDSGDFFGVHILLCRETPEGLDPIMGLKSIFLSRCKAFKQDFPAFHLFEGIDTPDHLAATKKIIEDSEKNEEEVAYSASWTMDPDLKKDPSLKKFCRDLVTFFLIRFYESRKVENVIAGAATRFKIEEIKFFVGFEPVSRNNKALPSFKCKAFFGEPVLLMHWKKNRPEAKKWASSYDPLWSSRIEFSKLSMEKTQKKAA